MTFSIIARCPDSGAFGIAAATGMPGVGKLLTHAEAGVGAVATQALLNPYLGLDGIDVLRTRGGVDDPSQLLETLLSADPDRDCRQVAMIDGRGRSAVWTGAESLPWSGSRSGEGWSAQGNILPGPDVLEACGKCFDSSVGKDIAERLLLALEAGEAAGGDSRGTCSATIYVVEAEAYPLWDIRVDAHETPLAELRRLYHLFARDLVPHIRKMPSRHATRPSSDRGWAA